MAAKVNALLADPERARGMGAAGKARAQEYFSISREVAEFAAVLEEAAGSR